MKHHPNFFTTFPQKGKRPAWLTMVSYQARDNSLFATRAVYSVVHPCFILLGLFNDGYVICSRALASRLGFKTDLVSSGRKFGAVHASDTKVVVFFRVTSNESVTFFRIKPLHSPLHDNPLLPALNLTGQALMGWCCMILNKNAEKGSSAYCQ